MAYASTKDLEARWRPLTPEEGKAASVLLEDASAILDACGYGEACDDILSIVTCNMVRRAMEATGDAFGIDGQPAPSTGWNSSLPAGEMRPQRWEVSMLRGGSRVGFAEMRQL